MPHQEQHQHQILLLYKYDFIVKKTHYEAEQPQQNNSFYPLYLLQMIIAKPIELQDTDRMELFQQVFATTKDGVEVELEPQSIGVRSKADLLLQKSMIEGENAIRLKDIDEKLAAFDK